MFTEGNKDESNVELVSPFFDATLVYTMRILDIGSLYMYIDTIATPNFQNGWLIKLELTMWGWPETLINSYTWMQRDTVQSALFMIFSVMCVIVSLTLF